MKRKDKKTYCCHSQVYYETQLEFMCKTSKNVTFHSVTPKSDGEKKNILLPECEYFRGAGVQTALIL